MSFVIAAPDLVAGAATDLAGIRSSLAEAASTAAFPTTGIASAAQDEVSLAVASLFGNVGQEFQALSARAQVFHAQFVEMMNAGAGAYAAAETVNAGQTLLNGGIVGNIGGTLGGSLGGVEAAVGQFGGSVSAGLNGAVAAVQADVSGVSSAILGAPASLSGAVQTGVQGVSGAVNGFGTQLEALATGGVPGLITSANVFANQIVGPYDTLVSNTLGNLQTIATTTINNPFPFLHQLVNNQVGYAQSIATAIGTGLVNLPTELANLPATLQAGIQGLLAFNPVPYVQEFINQQIGYVQTVVTGLQSAAQDFVTGLAGLPSAFQTAFQDLLAGNVTGALNAVQQGLQNLFVTGLGADFVSPYVIVNPTGTLGDILPILNIPGEMAQNFVNFLPPSIPTQIAQNFTNLLTTFTNTAVVANLNTTTAVHLTVPLLATLGFDLVGSPLTTWNAMQSSVGAFVGAVQTGNVSGAIAAVLDAPAVVANGFLNGQMTVTLPPFDLFGLQSQTIIPIGGIISPLETATILLGGPPGLPTDTTSFGGIVPGLLNYLPQALAEAIGAPIITVQ
ncbi:PE family protein [Mycobacterium sp. HUMS_1102779]|uniref:PE family protein n=1 Tax=Mycobacterium sp. HUMS_1102779 TaxID=3383487 RepID=UPI003899E195